VTTLAALTERWNHRDDRYSMRRRNGVLIAITEDEHNSIIAFRRSEAEELDNERERAKALTMLSVWIPPRR